MSCNEYNHNQLSIDNKINVQYLNDDLAHLEDAIQSFRSSEELFSVSGNVEMEDGGHV